MNVRWIPLLAVAVISGSGCFSKTYIYSKPSGASAVLDQSRLLGKTPIELDEQVWVWTKHSVTVSADGYAPRTIQIRSTGINYGYAVACVCTLGLFFPLALLSEYPKQYIVELGPSVTTAPAQASISAARAISFR